MPEYTKHMILNTVHVFYIYNKNNVHPFSIFYNISIISFLSLCVSKCIAWKIFHIYCQPCNCWCLVHASTSDWDWCGIWYMGKWVLCVILGKWEKCEEMGNALNKCLWYVHIDWWVSYQWCRCELIEHTPAAGVPYSPIQAGKPKRSVHIGKCCRNSSVDGSSAKTRGWVSIVIDAFKYVGVYVESMCWCNIVKRCVNYSTLWLKTCLSVHNDQISQSVYIYNIHVYFNTSYESYQWLDEYVWFMPGWWWWWFSSFLLQVGALVSCIAYKGTFVRRESPVSLVKRSLCSSWKWWITKCILQIRWMKLWISKPISRRLWRMN